MPAKKKPDLGKAVIKFLDESGLTDQLKAKAAELGKVAVNAAFDHLKPPQAPSLSEPQLYARPHTAQTEASPQRPVEDPNDPYFIMGVRKEADLDDIHAVYRSKVKRLRPDLIEGDRQQFEKIHGAWLTIQAERGGGK